MTDNANFQTDNEKPTNSSPLIDCRLSVVIFALHRR